MQASESVQNRSREAEPHFGTPSNEALLEAIAEKFSREILLSTMESGKSIEEISVEQKIPLSTCYRRVAELVEKGVLVVERIVITGTGKKFSIYRAAFRGIHIDVASGRMNVQTQVNEDAVERLRSRWLSMRYTSTD